MIESHITPAGAGVALAAMFPKAGTVNVVLTVASAAVTADTMTFVEHRIELPRRCGVAQGALHMGVLLAQREARLVMVEPGITPAVAGVTFTAVSSHCSPVYVLRSVAGIAGYRR